MLKLVSIVRRKPGLAVVEFQDHWLKVHGPLVRRLPGLRRYIQSHTRRSAYAKLLPAADGIAELWFDDSNALRALQGTRELASVAADEEEFIDAARHDRLFIDEYVIKDGAAPSDGVKSIEFVRRKAGMPIPEFQRYWREVHGPLGASIGPVRRYVQNHTRASAYERSQPPALDGLAITWFDDTNAMRASALTDEYASTRADEPNFLTEPLDFIITDEHVLLS